MQTTQWREGATDISRRLQMRRVCESEHLFTSYRQPEVRLRYCLSVVIVFLKLDISDCVSLLVDRANEICLRQGNSRCRCCSGQNPPEEDYRWEDLVKPIIDASKLTDATAREKVADELRKKKGYFFPSLERAVELIGLYKDLKVNPLVLTGQDHLHNFLLGLLRDWFQAFCNWLHDDTVEQLLPGLVAEVKAALARVNQVGQHTARARRVTTKQQHHKGKDYLALTQAVSLALQELCAKSAEHKAILTPHVQLAVTVLNLCTTSMSVQAIPQSVEVKGEENKGDGVANLNHRLRRHMDVQHTMNGLLDLYADQMKSTYMKDVKALTGSKKWHFLRYHSHVDRWGNFILNTTQRHESHRLVVKWWWQHTNQQNPSRDVLSHELVAKSFLCFCAGLKVHGRTEDQSVQTWRAELLQDATVRKLIDERVLPLRSRRQLSGTPSFKGGTQLLNMNHATGWVEKHIALKLPTLCCNEVCTQMLQGWQKRHKIYRRLWVGNYVLTPGCVAVDDSSAVWLFVCCMGSRSSAATCLVVHLTEDIVEDDSTNGLTRLVITEEPKINVFWMKAERLVKAVNSIVVGNAVFVRYQYTR
jgi:hypothetical protein